MSDKPPREVGQEPQDLPLLLDSIVRLESASSEAGMPLEKIFYAASEGEIELLFARPPIHPRIVLRPRGSEQFIGEPNFLCTPDYFALLPGDCRQLLDRPIGALVTHSTLGYRSRNNHTNLSRLDAGDADKRALFPVQVNGEDFVSGDGKFGFWAYWSLWSDAGPIQYAVRREDVFVRVRELKRWRIEKFYPALNVKFSAEPNPETSLLASDIDDDFKSRCLLRMCEAAYLFWAAESVIADNSLTHPRNETITQWFLDCEPSLFTKSSAENAARLIKPAFAMRAQPNT